MILNNKIKRKWKKLYPRSTLLLRVLFSILGQMVWKNLWQILDSWRILKLKELMRFQSSTKFLSPRSRRVIYGDRFTLILVNWWLRGSRKCLFWSLSQIKIWHFRLPTISTKFWPKSPKKVKSLLKTLKVWEDFTYGFLGMKNMIKGNWKWSWNGEPTICRTLGVVSPARLTPTWDF